MSSITPGTWRAEKGIEDEPERWCVVAERDNKAFFVAVIENGAPGDTLETEAANARLIAAAPELLDALADALCFLDAVQSTSPEMEAAKLNIRTEAAIAIAKATGDAP